MNIYIVQIDCKIVCPVFIHLLKSYSRLFHTIFILLITLRVIVKLEIKAFKNTCFHCSHCPQQGCSSRYNRFHNSVLLLRGGFISVNVQYPSSVKKKRDTHVVHGLWSIHSRKHDVNESSEIEQFLGESISSKLVKESV